MKIPMNRIIPASAADKERYATVLNYIAEHGLAEDGVEFWEKAKDFVSGIEQDFTTLTGKQQHFLRQIEDGIRGHRDHEDPWAEEWFIDFPHSGDWDT